MFRRIGRELVQQQRDGQGIFQGKKKVGPLEIVRLEPLPTEYACLVELARDLSGRNYVDVSGMIDGSEDLLAIEFVDCRLRRCCACQL
jgi:hypothetical protein